MYKESIRLGKASFSFCKNILQRKDSEDRVNTHGPSGPNIVSIMDTKKTTTLASANNPYCTQAGLQIHFKLNPNNIIIIH